MTTPNIQFLNFSDAVEVAKKEPGVKLVGLQFRSPFTRLDVYLIYVDPDEPGFVNVNYEGGELFDLGGEEDFYDIDDVPVEAKNLCYARLSDLGNGAIQIMGMTSEFVLQAVLPGLSPDARYRDQYHFRQAAGSAYAAFWRQE